MAIKYSKSRWEKIQSILDQVLDTVESERDEKLISLCADDTLLKQEVQELLETDNQSDTLFERPAVELASSLIEKEDKLADTLPEITVSQIGPYTLCEELGRGGMGVVYRAERNDGEFDQQVAIKLLSKEAKGTKGSLVMDRFRREQQLLASLVHPNIARLYDGGFTESGQAFIVMEYVAGMHLDQYCREKGLSIDARLHLLLKVIDALAYAHNQLVVHRDIKTSNILVTFDGQVKLLDFGIAKLLEGHELADLTRTGEHIMTPGSAAPEQFKNQNVTLATDIYQLGLIAYELLTGKQAYRDKARSITDLVQMISQEEPSPPSVIIDKTTVFQANESRGNEYVSEVDIRKVRNKLQGDLDAIVLKMLMNAPSDRYSSMRALEADINAYFNNCPVMARKNDFSYFAQKYIRRHWRSLSVACAFFVFLVSYAVTVTYQAKEIREALIRTEIEREKSENVSVFLTNVFKAADPNVAGLEEVTAETLLDQGQERILSELKDVPEIQTHMLNLFGEIYFSQGLYAKSESVFEHLLEKQRLKKQADHDLANALRQLAVSRMYNGKYEQAKALFEESLTIYREISPSKREQYAEVLAAYGELKYWQGEYDSAVDMLGESIKILKPLNDGQHEKLAEALNNLANIQHARGEPFEARNNMRKTLSIQKNILGEKHSYYSVYLTNFAIMLVDMEVFDEAENLANQALELQRELLDQDHPYIAETLKSLGVLNYRRGELVTAESYLRAVVSMYGESKTSISQATSFMWLGSVLQDLEKYEEADDYYKKMIAIFHSVSPSGEAVGRGLGRIASLAHAQGDLILAQARYKEALDLMPEKNMRATFSMVGYSQLLLEMGDAKSAEKYLREALEIRIGKVPSSHSFIAEIEVLLGIALQHQGLNEKAEPLLTRGLESLDRHAFFKYGNRQRLIRTGHSSLKNARKYK